MFTSVTHQGTERNGTIRKTGLPKENKVSEVLRCPRTDSEGLSTSKIDKDEAAKGTGEK